MRRGGREEAREGPGEEISLTIRRPYRVNVTSMPVYVNEAPWITHPPQTVFYGLNAGHRQKFTQFHDLPPWHGPFMKLGKLVRALIPLRSSNTAAHATFKLLSLT